MLLIALRLIVSTFFILHLGYWAVILTKIEWVAYSSMVRPPTLIMLAFSVFGLYLVFPYGRKNKKRFCSWGMVLALSVFVVGATMDLVDRIQLVEAVEEAKLLRTEDSYHPLSVGQKWLMVAMLRKEPIRINWGKSLVNMFLGYNSCVCGDGDGIEEMMGGMLFSCKHGNEMYIRGFLSFYTTRNIVWNIEDV